MDESNYLDEAVKWFQLRPEGEVIRWYSDHVSADRPWSAGWIDVQIEALENDLGWSWVFSINSPEHDDDEDEPVSHDESLIYVVEPDAHVMRVWRPDTRWYDDYAVIKPLGVPFTECEYSRIEQLRRETSGRTSRSSAWTVARITDWLDEWVAEVAERPDISFGWDDSDRVSPMVQRAEQIVADIQSGKVKTITFRGLVHKKDEGNGNG